MNARPTTAKNCPREARTTDIHDEFRRPSVGVPQIETAEGDKRPLDLLDEPMVWRGGRHGVANNSGPHFRLRPPVRTDGLTDRGHVSPAMLQSVRHDEIAELAGASDRVFYIPVTTGPDATELERRVRDFAATWLRIGVPGLGDALLNDPILVLGTQGTSAVPRDAFLAAVAGRQATVNAADTATTLTATTVTPLGDRLLLATMTWSFRHGSDEVNLVSDFLLQREDDDRLRCFAYLPRTNVLDHLG